MVLQGGNNSTYLGLNQSLPWGVGAGAVDGNLSLGSSQAEAVIRAPTMKVSVFYLYLLLLFIFMGFIDVATKCAIYRATITTVPG